MEALLSLAFDNISSYDGPKIRKGLRQLESLLAQICLSTSPSGNQSAAKPSHRRTQSVIPPPTLLADPGSSPPPRKQLSQLKDDPAFREFFKLQEGFEWNVALRLVSCLDRLLGKSNDGQNDLLILACLDLIQGILLLHPPSRSLFNREIHMNHLLDLLEPINPPALQSATLLTLVTSLLSTPSNTRTFESLDGLLTVTSLFKSRSTSREVKTKLLEFLYFYLMPETPSLAGVFDSQAAAAAAAVARKNGIESGRKRADSDGETRTTKEKQALLGRYLSDVDDLVADLNESAPFGMAVC